MKRILLIGLVFFIIVMSPGTACASAESSPSVPFASQTSDILEDASLEEIDDYLYHLDNNLSEFLEDFSLSGIWRGVKDGDFQLSASGLFALLGKVFFKEVLASWALLGQLLLLALLSIILSSLGGAFEKENISRLARGVIYLLLAAIAISAFSVSLEVAKEAVDMMSGFLYAVLPLLMILLAAMGGVSSVGILHPSMLFAISVLMTAMSRIIFPLIYFSAILRLISHISSKFSVDKLAGLFKDIALGFMSFGVGIFIAFMGVSGIASASIDGLAVKAAKSASGFIPIVGRSFADALDSVLGTALLLKNGIGVIGVVVILVICALPAAKILVQVLIFRLAGAVIQPLGDKQLANALTGLSNALLLLFAAVAICGLLFFFLLAISIGVGNITMMMR
ncbi:MAG: stage III sporulation protein AE [Bacillota bacterium]|jgi:stage III sporulation protein AE